MAHSKTEWWLTLTGQVAQYEPYYSVVRVLQESPCILSTAPIPIRIYAHISYRLRSNRQSEQREDALCEA